MDDGALVKSIKQGKLDLLRVFVKVNSNWKTYVCKEEGLPLVHLAISKFMECDSNRIAEYDCTRIPD